MLRRLAVLPLVEIGREDSNRSRWPFRNYGRPHRHDVVDSWRQWKKLHSAVAKKAAQDDLACPERRRNTPSQSLAGLSAPAIASSSSAEQPTIITQAPTTTRAGPKVCVQYYCDGMSPCSTVLCSVVVRDIWQLLGTFRRIGTQFFEVRFFIVLSGERAVHSLCLGYK